MTMTIHLKITVVSLYVLMHYTSYNDGDTSVIDILSLAEVRQYHGVRQSEFE